MDIKDFQTQVVSQIIESIKELNNKYGDNTIATNNIRPFGELKGGEFFEDAKGNRFFAIDVDFDMAVTVVDENIKDAGAKVTLASVFSVGGNVKGSKNSEVVNRIRYTLPMIVPIQGDE